MKVKLNIILMIFIITKYQYKLFGTRNTEAAASKEPEKMEPIVDARFGHINCIDRFVIMSGIPAIASSSIPITNSVVFR